MQAFILLELLLIHVYFITYTIQAKSGKKPIDRRCSDEIPIIYFNETVDSDLPICSGDQLMLGQWICDKKWYPTPDYTFCGCPHAKGRYNCHHKDSYAQFLPNAVKNKTCRLHPPEYFEKNPLPPGTKTLFAGNSFLRQVMESILCMFPDSIESKKVVLKDGGLKSNRGVAPMIEVGQSQCRGGPYVTNVENYIYDCPDLIHAKPNFTECYDNAMKVVFKNGAELYHLYSYDTTFHDLTKHIHGIQSLREFDFIVSNGAYANRMDINGFVSFVHKNKLTGVEKPKMIWAAMNGDNFSSAKEKIHMANIEVFEAFKISISQASRRVGALFGKSGDAHFCMPGPPEDVTISFLHSLL